MEIWGTRKHESLGALRLKKGGSEVGKLGLFLSIFCTLQQSLYCTQPNPTSLQSHDLPHLLFVIQQEKKERKKEKKNSTLVMKPGRTHVEPLPFIRSSSTCGLRCRRYPPFNRTSSGDKVPPSELPPFLLSSLLYFSPLTNSTSETRLLLISSRNTQQSIALSN